MVQYRESQKLDDLIEKVKSSLLEKPGRSFAQNSKETSLPKAAVAMILQPDKVTNDLLVLLIERKTRVNDPWSGHMALPGGRYSEGDQNLFSTVIREVMEETGLDLREFSILGALDEIVPGNFSIRVTPYIALSKEEDISVKIDPIEVESFVWIPLSFFGDRNNLKPYSITRLGQQLQVPSYNFAGDQIIWGMTLRIIQDLVSRIH